MVVNYRINALRDAFVIAGLLLVMTCVVPVQAFADSSLAGGISQVSSQNPQGLSADAEAPSEEQAHAADVAEIAAGSSDATVAEPEKKAKIVEGTYSIRMESRKSLSLGFSGKTAKSGSKLSVKRTKGAPRLFYIRAEGGGRYSIQLAASKWFLTEEGGRVVLSEWTDSRFQMWWATGDTAISLVNVGTGEALSAKGASGARVVGKAYSPGESQEWALSSEHAVASGYYRLRNALGMNLSVAGTGYKENGNVNVLKKKDAAAQCFRVKASGSSYRIMNMRSYQLVSTAGSSKKNGANVIQRMSGKGKSQLWKARFDRSGRIVFVNAKSGRALSAKAGSRKVKANVVQAKRDDSKAQGWKLVPVSRYTLSGDNGLDRSLAAILSEHNGLRAAFNYVRDGFSWNDPDTAYRSGRYMSEYNTKRYAKEMIRMGKGSCYCSSSLFMWLARALGYDARVTVGYLESNVPGMLGAHSWVEVRKQGATYVCDPDCERGYRFRNWFMEPYDTTPAEYHFW